MLKHIFNAPGIVKERLGELATNIVESVSPLTVIKANKAAEMLQHNLVNQMPKGFTYLVVVKRINTKDTLSEITAAWAFRN